LLATLSQPENKLNRSNMRAGLTEPLAQSRQPKVAETKKLNYISTDQTGQTGSKERLMHRRWQMQEAKAKFGELVRRAATEGPQIVTYRGAETAVVLSIEEFRRLEAARPSFVDHLLGGPKLDDVLVDLINDRSPDTGRDVDL
jgi:prevent-host-death family protein